MLRADIKLALQGDKTALATLVSRINQRNFGDDGRLIEVELNKIESRYPGGKPIALFLRGVIAGRKLDFVTANQYYASAIELGNADAMVQRAYHCNYGPGINVTLAGQLYDQAIELNQPEAMWQRAAMLKNGNGGEINLARAASLYRRVLRYPGYRGALKYLRKLVNDETSDSNEIRYHFFMGSKESNILTGTAFKEVFDSCPEIFAAFYQNDSLLSVEDKNIITEYVAQYYLGSVQDELKKAEPDREKMGTFLDKMPMNSSCYAAAVELIAKCYLDWVHFKLNNSVVDEENKTISIDRYWIATTLKKVPAQSSRFKEALALQADNLYFAIMEHAVPPQNLPQVLLELEGVHRLVLMMELKKREVTLNEMQHTRRPEQASKELEVEIEMARIRNLLEDPAALRRRSAAGMLFDGFATDNSLLLYAERRKKIDAYANRVQEFLQNLGEKLQQFATKKEEGDLWCKPMSPILKEIQEKIANLPISDPIEILKQAMKVFYLLEQGAEQKDKDEVQFCKQALLDVPVFTSLNQCPYNVSTKNRRK